MNERRRGLKNRKGYFAAVFSILFISGIFFIICNFSNIPGKQALEEVVQNSTEISEALYEMEVRFNQYGQMLNTLIENQTNEGAALPDDIKKLDVLTDQLNIILRQFTEERDMVNGYFFELNATVPATEYEIYHNRRTDKTAHITTLMSTTDVENVNAALIEKGEPFWKTGYNAFSDTVYLQYLLPLYEAGDYIGFIGVLANTDALADVIAPAENWREKGLLTDAGEVLTHSSYKPGTALGTLYDGMFSETFREEKLHNYMRLRSAQGTSIIIAYTTLPSGQVFLETHELFPKMAKANFLTLCVTGIAVLAVTLVQKSKNTGRSILDGLTGRLIAKRGERILSEDEENRMKAVIALELSLCLMLTAFGFYQLLFEQDIGGFLSSIAWSICNYCFTYQYIRGRLTEIKKLLFISLMFLVMVGFHVFNGGFGDEGTGASISWLLGILVLGCFLIKSEWMNHVFGIFVVFLFLDVMVEIYFLQNNYYERMLVFVTSLLYAGFSLHTAVSIYLKESISDGKRITGLLEEVKESQTYLVQQEKMVALGQLISGVAHEINTPVGAVKGAAQTMESGLLPMLRLLKRCQEEFENADYACFYGLVKLAGNGIKEMKNTIEIRQAKKELKRYLDEIELPEREEVLDMLIRLEITDIEELKVQKEILENPDLCEILKIVVNLSGFIVGIQTILFATNRVSRIVFALKSYAYNSVSDGMVEVDVIKNIENILILYHNQLKQNIEVVKDYDEISNIKGKPEELAQVWSNLVQNAIYAMKDGGILTIRVKISKAQRVQVSIEDTGVGIPKSVVERIYEPFFTTKPLGEGSGLGLDISRKVVLAHGGTIRVESKMNEGTRFIVTLPLEHEAPCQGEQNQEVVMKETVQ